MVRVRLRGEIRALQRRLGVTTIMVTHDQEEALSMADRIVVMNQGAIEQVGTPREVYERPATPFVADFVGKINVLPASPKAAARFRVGAARARACAARHRGRQAVKHLPAARRRRGLADAGPATPNVFDARIDKIEFLGAYCLVRRRRSMRCGAPAAHRLPVAQLPSPSTGSRSAARCRSQLLPERMRVFS